ncbi:Methyltransferase domain-containing protein [Gracilibacillus orientalis]|uniref:Methyltransferase domain-containing protein n=1 Tax=Gracilibacillus orientalis TaxID=334253 RepID=A0A1I4HC20_9BACI|nr:methyltransferase domain-containing protein [Gracilibacillus orientalis]SFL39754.1 Methyltransferase domain-containing protein [Gracilibacillus orientalis]
MTKANSKAKQRATLNNSSVIDARSLSQSHKRLAELLEPGMTVLDVGCGTGAITSGIAEAVGANGKVVGIDNNPTLLDTARKRYPNIIFEIADIYNLPFENQFDIVTTSLVLQWLDQPQQALNNLVKSVKPGGKVVVLDYNHEKLKWYPEVPESMKYFYDAFLRWRRDADMDNAIADHLREMFEKSRLNQIQVTSQHEEVNHGQESFETAVSIWADVAETKGEQMLQDKLIEKDMLKKAIKDYKEWIRKDAQSQGCRRNKKVDGTLYDED